jgi:hypothetical protein
MRRHRSAGTVLPLVALAAASLSLAACGAEPAEAPDEDEASEEADAVAAPAAMMPDDAPPQEEAPDEDGEG